MTGISRISRASRWAAPARFSSRRRAVHQDGRITHGDMGLWSDAHIAPLRRIADFLRAQGAMPAIQLGHAGRKASMQRPWHGNGPLDRSDQARGEEVWRIVAPSAVAMDEGWLMPVELTPAEMTELCEHFRRAALRAAEAGFGVVEVHGAHGYLLHSFLSPLSNRRNDAYGGDRAGRMRFPLEIVETVRAAWPKDRPMFFRTSSVDGIDGGWTLDDTVALARELKARDVDVIDCSSGGIAGSATAARIARHPGFQVPFAERIKRDTGIKTMAVGLILEPQQAEAVLQHGQADLIAIGRQALYDPNWPLHAERALMGDAADFERWPVQAGWWLERRERGLRALAAEPARK
jgi:2,4-dienoyl-CoA reductase-like NADH-dependent reductase (Old Yellow Enzyme family)